MAPRATKAAPVTEADNDSRGDRTRKLIKTVIARLAARKEVADITLSDICKAAKLTTGALYFHFKGKDDAVEEMVIDEIHDLYGRLVGRDEARSFEELVRRVLDESTRFHQTHKKLPRAIQVVINTRPRAYAAWIEARKPLVERFERTIAEARAAHGLPTEQAPYLAHFILNSMEDLAMDVFQWGNPTLKPFADSSEGWNQRQSALWTWAVLAPIPGLPTKA